MTDGFLGIDTSNYSTSAAYIGDEVRSAVKLLPVKKGEGGIRQSDAVFHHTKQLPSQVAQVCGGRIAAVGVSCKPREAEGSYMPCFLTGECAADVIGSASAVPVYKTSHQVGHIMAALYSAGRTELVDEPFIAFHVSGGTTDSLYCEPDKDRLIRVKDIGTSLDLYAGQLVDRAGLMLGLDFPCGIELERLAQGADKRLKARPVVRGFDVSMSGFENQARKLYDGGESRENTALFVLDAVLCSVTAMTRAARERYGELPVVYAGGVMSDKIIKDGLTELGNVYFAEPALSRDNAVGIALYAKMMYEKRC